jgi:protein-tyrosine phosphatase
VLRAGGIRLDEHMSQPLSEQMVRHADLILTMTRSHRNSILASWPEAADRVQLLRRDETDIVDPIGGPVEVYRRCAEQLQSELAERVNELDLT